MKGLVRRNKKVFIFISSLVLFLVGAGVVQEILKNVKPFEDVPVVSVETKKQGDTDETSEVLQKPVKEGVKVSKGFYDTNLSEKESEKGSGKRRCRSAERGTEDSGGNLFPGNGAESLL